MKQDDKCNVCLKIESARVCETGGVCVCVWKREKEQEKRKTSNREKEWVQKTLKKYT